MKIVQRKHSHTSFRTIQIEFIRDLPTMAQQFHDSREERELSKWSIELHCVEAAVMVAFAAFDNSGDVSPTPELPVLGLPIFTI